MSGWLVQVALGSAGLALTALATAVVLHGWRHRPVASYRLASAVLAAALLLPAAQLVSRSLGAPFAEPLRTWIADVTRAPEPAPRPASVRSRPDATPLALELPARLGVQPAARSSESGMAPLVARPTPTRTRGLDPGRVWNVLLALYALGVLAFLVRTARRLLSTRALLRAARPVADERTLAVWRAVLAPSPLARRARLVVSDRVRTPACSGLTTPVVVLPEDEDFSARPEVLECVLAHELIHLERRDAWIQLGEECLRALFWFHPAAWWLRARLERLREVSCDLLVVQRTGKRRRYASALLEYAEWMQSGVLGPDRHTSSTAAVLPWSTTNGQLTRRIEMLLRKETKPTKVTRWGAPVAVATVFSLLWGGQLALAAGTAPAPEALARVACDHGELVDALLTPVGQDKGCPQCAAAKRKKQGQRRVARVRTGDGDENVWVVDMTEKGASVAAVKAKVDAAHRAGATKYRVITVQDGKKTETIYVVEGEDGKGFEAKLKAAKKSKAAKQDGNVWFFRGDEDEGATQVEGHAIVICGDDDESICLELPGGEGKLKSKRLTWTSKDGTTTVEAEGGTKVRLGKIKGWAKDEGLTRWLFRSDESSEAGSDSPFGEYEFDADVELRFSEDGDGTDHQVFEFSGKDQGQADFNVFFGEEDEAECRSEGEQSKGYFFQDESEGQHAVNTVFGLGSSKDGEPGMWIVEGSEDGQGLAWIAENGEDNPWIAEFGEDGGAWAVIAGDGEPARVDDGNTYSFEPRKDATAPSPPRSARLFVPGPAAAPDAGKVEALERKLDEAREQLDRQRAELETLKRKLEKLHGKHAPASGRSSGER